MRKSQELQQLPREGSVRTPPLHCESDNKVRLRIGDNVYTFPAKEYVYLCRVAACTTMDKAGEVGKEMGISDFEIGKWMRHRDAQRFLSEKMKEQALKAVWDDGHWLSEMVRVWEGEKTVTKNQIEAGKEIGMRVSPKVEKVQHEFEDADFIFMAKKERE